ncbi:MULTISPECIES: DNA cytosine methyltransferase [unclassified Shewanella]|uniref:DNA cytosine methyltransferase n=1 Tax=Shewanella TaxID=22 RepID=UPI0021D9C44F|nr:MULTISPECIES: DNA cytosine methyltransferase [unclassified Shewanella]EGT3627677.1 DNA cytosine methyltransferase [Morganella morganii]MCU8042545.1 DNA cytosine methyltransferase [Shewanella sp. SM68]MCU8046284.1 DNA cytosine methyltransferase [Shewanella sp. SM65]
MLKTISLYTGAGGLDLGLEAAGFETTVAVEFNKWACETLNYNRPKWNTLHQDIHDVPSSEIFKVGGFSDNEPSLLIGGPPCQPFSKAAYWSKGDTKRLDDPRADTLTAYLRVLRDLKPKAFLMENVFGITYKGKDEAIDLLKGIIDKINKEEGTNYNFNLGVINAADFGVPQIRERVFIIGSRDGTEFKFPVPTHKNPEKDDNDLFSLENWRTAWDAIGDLNDLSHSDIPATGKWAELLPSIPEGKNYLHHTNRGEGLPLFGWRTRYWSFLLKLAKDKPSWTIQAQPGSAIGPFHWKNRRLSTRELCRLQTFPDDYEILGGRTEVQRQLGNAVPSLMGEILGREIKRQFFGIKTVAPLILLPAVNTTHKRKQPVEPVDAKYLNLLGEHLDHPGTGKGPQASSTSDT